MRICTHMALFATLIAGTVPSPASAESVRSDPAPRITEQAAPVGTLDLEPVRVPVATQHLDVQRSARPVQEGGRFPLPWSTVLLALAAYVAAGLIVFLGGGWF